MWCGLQDPAKRFGAQLGALSGGRVGLTSVGTTNLQMVMAIAVRLVFVFLLLFFFANTSLFGEEGALWVQSCFPLQSQL